MLHILVQNKRLIKCNDNCYCDVINSHFKGHHTYPLDLPPLSGTEMPTAFGNADCKDCSLDEYDRLFTRSLLPEFGENGPKRQKEKKVYRCKSFN